MKKKTGWIVLIAVIAVVALVVGWGVGSYNSLVTMQESVENKQAAIQTQLQRRSDLIPNLVNTVKGYVKHEQEVYTAISDARSKLAGAKTLSEQDAANTELGAQPIAGGGGKLPRSESQPKLHQFAGRAGGHRKPAAKGAAGLQRYR